MAEAGAATNEGLGACSPCTFDLGPAGGGGRQAERAGAAPVAAGRRAGLRGALPGRGCPCTPSRSLPVGAEASVVYFRAGYTPNDYPTARGGAAATGQELLFEPSRTRSIRSASGPAASCSSDRTPSSAPRSGSTSRAPRRRSRAPASSPAISRHLPPSPAISSHLQPSPAISSPLSTSHSLALPLPSSHP